MSGRIPALAFWPYRYTCVATLPPPSGPPHEGPLCAPRALQPTSAAALGFTLYSCFVGKKKNQFPLIPPLFPLFTESIAYLLTFILWWFLFCLFESPATELGPVSVGRQAALPDRYCGRATGCLFGGLQIKEKNKGRRE